jgi:hypothetical protein
MKAAVGPIPPVRRQAFSTVCDARAIGCGRSVRSRNIYRVSQGKNARTEFSGSRTSLIIANLNQLRAHLRPQNGESQMTKMRTLSAAIILSAAVATPVFAQDTGVRGPGSRYGLASQTAPRGAYNQLNGPSDATPRALDDEHKRDIENFGFSGRDPSRVGGEDPDLKPSY